MEIESIKFFGRDLNDPNCQIDTKTPQYRQRPRKSKWVVSYRQTPPIPDYITVIETEYQPKKE